jgi:hypothetical protein
MFFGGQMHFQVIDWLRLRTSSAQRLAHQPPRARQKKRQKTSDLAREAVGCMGVFGAGLWFPSAARMRVSLLHEITWHNGHLVEPHPAHDHTLHNGRSAPRACVPRQHHGRRHDGKAPRALNLATATNQHERCADHAAQRPNGLPISRRERAAKRCQKTNDLARAAVGCIGVFGAPVAFPRSSPASADHTILGARRHNGPQSESRPAQNHALHNEP